MDVGYIDKVTGNEWITEAQQISAMLSSLIKARRKFNTPKA
jgi:hypothetical protein